MEGDFFGTANHETLPFFYGLHKVGRLQQGFMSTGVQPRGASPACENDAF